MNWLYARLTAFGQLDCLNILFRGISQVIFINNPLAGLCITLALGAQHPRLCAMGVLGCMLSTAFAVYLRCPAKDISEGLFGFSGTLCGFAAYILSQSHFDLPPWLLLYVALPFIYLNVVVTAGIGSWFTKRTGLPIFTLPYNLSIYILTTLLAFTSPELLIQRAEPAACHDCLSWSWPEIANTILINFGQVFFIGDVLTSTVILGIVAIFSISCAAAGLLGSLIFVAIAGLSGTDSQLVVSGTAGYNVVLTSIVVAAAFRQSFLRSTAMATLASAWSTFVTLGLATLLPSLGLPLLTLPFCLATLSFLFSLSKNPAWLLRRLVQSRESS
ncbi:urea transporter [Pseudomonas sp. LPB0260]|uniref:urea transporter n=1 Tax=Pseudomonas sp. LPB0260 TaxID=2614442 RepID=UPI0015C285CD|nr:urea transporter [Pseudomonas sp. LPB0260]QLC74690.1 urea transporter [Pseudomonas sp. LPB0260]